MRKFVALFIIVAFGLIPNMHAQQSMTKMHSLYIYNFIKNIQWKNVGNKYVIGIYANNTTVEEIKAVLGARNFNGKTFEIKRISSPAQASNCHIVFVSSANSSNVKKIKQSANLANTLLVSEKGQLNNGAAIAFVLENAKLKFRINEATCNASGLKVSKALLALAL